MTRARSHRPDATTAGFSPILAAIDFVAVFSSLAGSFGYPDSLDRPAGAVLPRLPRLSHVSARCVGGVRVYSVGADSHGRRCGVTAFGRAPSTHRSLRGMVHSTGQCVQGGAGRGDQ